MDEAPAPPRCRRCQGDAVRQLLDAPDFPHICSYRCGTCGFFWTTNRAGSVLLTGQDPPPGPEDEWAAEAL